MKENKEIELQSICSNGGVQFLRCENFDWE